MKAQDSIPLKKWQTKKFEIMLTAFSCIAPRIYGEGIVNNNDNKSGFGGDFLTNYHFTNHSDK